MTNKKRPMVITVIGKVKSFRIGRMVALTNPRMAAVTANATQASSSTVMSGTTQAATQSAMMAMSTTKSAYSTMLAPFSEW